MKKILIILLYFWLTTNANAGWVKTLENELLSAGLLDENLKYTDVKAVTELLRELTNISAQSLPAKVNKYIEAVSIFYTPYGTNIIYKIHEPITSERAKEIDNSLLSTYLNSGLCDDIYSAKFTKANNFSINIQLIDINNKKIGDVKLDYSACSISHANEEIDWESVP